MLADAASAHPDGTFSLLRGGITGVNVPRNRPVFFRGAVVARIAGERGEAGKHEFKLACLTEDGDEVAPPVSGALEVPKGGGAVQLCLNLGVPLPRTGRYEFSILIDGQQKDAWGFDAKEKQP